MSGSHSKAGKVAPKSTVGKVAPVSAMILSLSRAARSLAISEAAGHEVKFQFFQPAPVVALPVEIPVPEPKFLPSEEASVLQSSEEMWAGLTGIDSTLAQHAQSFEPQGILGDLVKEEASLIKVRYENPATRIYREGLRVSRFEEIDEYVENRKGVPFKPVDDEFANYFLVNAYKYCPYEWVVQWVEFQLESRRKAPPLAEFPAPDARGLCRSCNCALDLCNSRKHMGVFWLTAFIQRIMGGIGETVSLYPCVCGLKVTEKVLQQMWNVDRAVKTELRSRFIVEPESKYGVRMFTEGI